MPTHDVCQQVNTPEQSFDEGYDPELADYDAVLALYTGGGSASSSAELSGQNSVGNTAVSAALFGGASGAATHVVKKGETLGTIAKLYTGDAKRYTELWQANQATLPNPNVVTEGQVLVLPDAWFNVRPGESEQELETTPSAQPEDDRSWFEQGMDSVSETVSGAWDTASDAVSGAWDTASNAASGAWDWASEGVSSAWDTATEGVSETWDAVFGEEEQQGPVTGSSQEAGQGKASAKAPAEGADIQGMSQFIWYGHDLRELDFEETKAAMKVVHEVMGIGSYTGTDAEVKTKEFTDAEKKKNPNNGYWWFDADNKPTWDGSAGKKCIINVVKSSTRINDWTTWMSMNAPGDRPGWYVPGSNPVRFASQETKDFVAVPDSAQDLDLRNIPGGASCFATALSMMAQVGETPTRTNDVSGIVTDEEYEGKRVISVTTDAEAAAKALRYIEFETSQGRPVFTGVTYTNRNGNSDKITDHWVVIDQRISEGQYSYMDPGRSATADTSSTSNVFVWDATACKLTSTDTKRPYTVSWIRPNLSSMDAWLAHEAEFQQKQTPA